jgi:hypothetical protein
LLCMEKKINNREDQFYEENTINQTMDWANQNHCNPCCKQTFEIFKIERYWWGWRAPCKPRRRVLKQGVPKKRSVMTKGLRSAQQVSCSSQGVHLL